MNDKNRLEVAQQLWIEKDNIAELKRGVDNDITAQGKKIKAVLSGEEELKGDAIKAMRGYYKKMVKLESERAELNAKKNKLVAAIEDCIFGRREFDADQLNFEDIYKEDEPAEPVQGVPAAEVNTGEGKKKSKK